MPKKKQEPVLLTKKETALKQIDEWMDKHGALFSHFPEDIHPDRTSWEDLRDKSQDAYYTLRDLKNIISEIEEVEG